MTQRNRTPIAVGVSAAGVSAAGVFAACAFIASLQVTANAQNAQSGQINQPAPGPAAQKTGLVPERERITDEKIYGDRKTLEAVQQRLRKLNEAGVAQQFYPLAKAQCWLDMAKTQYHENDRTGFVEESLKESAKITKVLEGDKSALAGMQTPLVAKSTLLRQDLWDQLNRHKANSQTLSCNAQTVACAEVRLVRAGHAEHQTGWRQATPHVQMVEDALRRADAEAKSCAPPPAVAKAAPPPVAVAAPPPAATPPPPPPPAPAPPPPPQIIERESFVLTSDALFRFNKGSGDQMLAGGQERLAAIAQTLKAYKSIAVLSIQGHTDRYGADDHNDKLSTQRAATVKAGLEALGVSASKIEVSGMGKRQPITGDRCPVSMPRPKAIDCLQPDRRVVIEARGIVK